MCLFCTHRSNVLHPQEAWMAHRDRCFRKRSAGRYPWCQPRASGKTHILDWRRTIQLSLVLGIQTLQRRLLSFLRRLSLSSSFLNCYGALLDPFQRFLTRLNLPSGTHPRFRCFALQNIAPPVHCFALEPANLTLRQDNLILPQMTFQHVPKRSVQSTDVTHRG